MAYRLDVTPSRRRRSAFGSILAVLAALAVASGVVGLWASRSLGNADAFAALAGGLLRDPVVRERLATVIVEPAIERSPPRVQRQRATIVATTRQILGDERFVAVFEDVLRSTHRSIFEGGGEGRLRLEPAVRAVATEIQRFSPEVATQLRAVEPPAPVVVSADGARRVRSLLDTERTVAIGLLAVGGILVVIAVLGAGPRALLPFGVALAGACVALVLLLLFARTLVGVEVASASRPAATAAFDVVIGGLRTTLLVTAAVGVAAAIAGGVLSRRA